MKTQQIVQNSANVIRITHIKKGDTYKRFDESYDYTYYGIIKSVLNDGTNTIIEAIEYRYSYSNMNVEHKVIRGNKDFIIFPATLEEIQNEFQSCIDKKKKDIEGYLESIEKAKKEIEITEKLISGEMQKSLTVPEFKELTQDEFNNKMLLN